MYLVIFFFKKINFIFFRLILFSGFVFLVGCNDNGKLYDLGNRLDKFITSQENQSELEIRLDTISSFKWDEVLIAGPYTDLNRFEEYDFSRFPNTIMSHDSFILIGFIKQKEGVKWIEVKRTKIISEIFKKNEIYPKYEAIFKNY